MGALDDNQAEIVLKAARQAAKRAVGAEGWSWLDRSEIQGAALEAGLRALPRWNPDRGALGAFLYTVGCRAACKAIAAAKRRYRRELIVDVVDQPGADDHLAVCVLRVDLTAAIRGLPPAEAQALVEILRLRLRGLSQRAIASRPGTGGSQSTIHRRLQLLRKSIA